MRMLDICAGRLGWAKAFLARGWNVTAVDLVRPPEVPDGVEFLQEDLTGLTVEFVKQFDFVCASTPCEKFSVFAMPHFHPNPPYPDEGIRLFNHVRSLCVISDVPHVMENVRAAQRFLGHAQGHCGPFYLWGNAVPPILPQGIKKGFQTGGQIISRLKAIDRKALTDYRRLNDGSWSSSKSEKRKEWTAKVATIPPELANCVADYAERLLEQSGKPQLVRR